MDSNQEPFAHPAPDSIPHSFEEAVTLLKPSAIIGQSFVTLPGGGGGGLLGF